MKNTIKFLAAVALLSVGFANAQVGVGTTTPDASAVLDVSSTTKGLLLPRLTTAERNAITSPATGLVIYNTDTKQIQVNTGIPAAAVWGGITWGGKAPRPHPIASSITWEDDDVAILLQSTHTGSIVFPSASAWPGRVIGINNRSGANRTIANTTGGDTGIYANEALSQINTNSGLSWFISDGTSWRLYSGRP